MVVCSLCKHDGHLKKDCPEDFKKVQLDPLPALTPEFLNVLNTVCEQCYSEYRFIRRTASTLKSRPLLLLRLIFVFFKLFSLCFQLSL